MKSCCFTGHRNIPAEDIVSVKFDLDITLRSLIAKGVSAFYCGAARGFDTMAAETVIHLKKTYPFLKLYLILPCRGQDVYWNESDKRKFAFILSHADDVQCLYESYNKHCMYERNKALIDSADICVCYLREKTGGSAFTVALAAKRGLHIIPIAGTGGIESELLSNQLNLESLEFE